MAAFRRRRSLTTVDSLNNGEAEVKRVRKSVPWKTAFVVFCTGLLGLAPNAASDPGYVGFEAGGPTFQNHASIVMESEDLVFSYPGTGDWQAELTYVLRNTADEGVEIPVAFPYQLGTDYMQEFF